MRAAEAIDEIVVRGARAPVAHARHAPTVASTVVEGEDLRRPGQTSADVLERVVGVQISRSGAASDPSTASLRGADARQTPVYLAGIRLNDDVSGAADLSQVPLFMIERVEVFRGNAPERGDRLGIGGAVFLWPRRPTTTRGGGGAEVGSYGHRAGWLAYETAAFDVGEAKPSSGALVAARQSAGENDYLYADDQGQRFDRAERIVRRDNADYSAHDAWALGTTRVGSARVDTVVSAFDREQGVTGLGVVPARRARASVRRLLAGVSLRAPCGVGAGCRLELATSFLGGSTTLVDPAAELPAVRAERLDNDGRRLTQRAAWRARPVAPMGVALSVVHAFETVDVVRARGVPRGGRRHATRLSGTLDGSVMADVLLSGLVAVECHGTRGQAERYGEPVRVGGGACGVLEPTGRIGARWTVAPRVELVGNVGRYVRVPTLGELIGTSAFVDGSEGLVAENGLTTDVGVRTSAGARPGGVSYGAEIFAFSRWAEDLVRYRRTSANVLSPFNVASARVAGLELLGVADLVGWVRLESAVTLLDAVETTESRAEDPTENDVLPLASRLVATSRVEAYRELPSGPLGLRRAALGVSNFYRSSRFADSAGLAVLPAQHRVDADAVVQVAGGAVTARFDVRNVLDRQQHDLLGMPLPGRTFLAGVEAWF